MGRLADTNGNLTQSIVEDLGTAIVTGQYPVRSALPFEMQLCEEYGASRPTIREAVKMLSAKGLLVARQRKGTTVQPESQWSLLDRDVVRWMMKRDFSLNLLIDLTEIRLAIEPRAAALAARTASDDQRQSMVRAIDRMIAAERGDEDPLEADIAFHTAVLHASNNPFFQQLADISEAALRFNLRRADDANHQHEPRAHDHKVVMDAILQVEPVLASRRMSDLIRMMLSSLSMSGTGAATA